MFYTKKLTALLAIFCAYSLLLNGTGGGDLSNQTCPTIAAGSGVSTKGNSNSCTITTGSKEQEGAGSELIEGLFNSVGDEVRWTIKHNTPIQNLNRITENKNFTLQYPGTGKMKLVKFIPTAGNAKNKEVSVLLVSFSIYEPLKNLAFPNENTKARENMEKQLERLQQSDSVRESGFKNLVKVYVKIGNDVNWTEFAELYTKGSPDNKKMSTEWTIMPDAQIKPAEKLYTTNADGVTTEYPAEALNLITAY